MRKASWLLALLVAVVLPGAALAQETGTITGQVLDQATQRGLAGAQVNVAGTTRSAVTDQQGRFSITAVRTGPQQLRATAAGYGQASAAVTVSAGQAASVTLSLGPAVGLEELVVIGYGEARRRDVAGAIASLRPQAIEETPTPSIDNALQGRLAGVQVVQNSGTPGAAMSVRIRGSSSISAGNQPLYVIDGVPLIQGNFNRSNATFGGQDIDALADLNPNEIEAIEVLKDASAAAIYGSRASNGVVLITTKRGRAGRTDVNFNAYYGTQERWKTVDFLNSDQYIEVKNDGIFNRFGDRNEYGYDDDGVENPVEVPRGINTDWIDEVMRSAPISNLDGSVRGGSERVRYYVGGSSFNQEGIVYGMGYRRLNGRVNLDYAPFERLTLGTNVSLANSVIDRSRGDNTIFGPFANAIAQAPTQPVYDENGDYFQTYYANPVGLYKENSAEERSVRVLGNTFAQYALGDAFTARVSAGLDQYNLRSRIYDSPVVGLGTGSNGSGTAGSSAVTKATYEGTLSYNGDFGTRHALSGVIGASYEQNDANFSTVEGTQFPSEAFRYLTSAAQITAGTDSVSTWALQSYFGRASYTFDDRVTTTFNVRADGSSRFGENNRFGVFPSASVLWHVGDEGFMQGQDVIGNLALRASYGRTGNQAGIGNFASRGLFAGGYNYNDEPGIAPSQLSNPDLKWETTDQLNLGTDFSIFGDRLSFTADYYVKKTKDLLVARPIPRSTGFDEIWANIGSMENRGVELAARARLIEGDDFSWEADLNVSRNRNEVTALLNDEPIMSGTLSRVEVGQPLGVFYGYRMDGIFQTVEEVKAHATQNSRTAPGDIRFKDLNNDGRITADDRTIIGNPWPELEGGFNNTLSFRNLDLTVFTQFSLGNDIYNDTRSYTDQYGSYDDNHTTRALERWTPANPSATEPRAVYGDPNGNTRRSDRFVEDGSFVRVKNVVLGYNLPEGVSGRMGLRNARVYLQAQNLFTFTDYSGWDPEVNYAGDTSITRGMDFYTLPQARTLTAGFSLGF